MNKHLVSSHNSICLLIMLSFFRVINDSLQITNYKQHNNGLYMQKLQQQKILRGINYLLTPRYSLL
jgi:hypothetical protein